MVMMNLGEPEGNIKALFNDPVRFLYRLTVIKRGMVCPSGFLILWHYKPGISLNIQHGSVVSPEASPRMTDACTSFGFMCTEPI